MSTHLLDVNLLIALAWPSHVHHDAAHRWFTRHASAGWATCPVTQCGFVRVSSNTHVIPDAVTPQTAITVLRQMTRHPRHVFWHDGVSLCAMDSAVSSLVMGHRQVTDAYLLSLAAHHRAALATLDRGMRALAPPGTFFHDMLTLITSD